MKLIRTIAGLFLAIVFVIFAIANRRVVPVTWSPAHPDIELPLYIVALGALAAGFFLGAMMIWLESLPGRFERGRQKRRINKLEKELHGKDTAPAPGDWTALPPSSIK